MFSLSKKQEPIYFNPFVYEAAEKGELSKIQEFINQGGWIDMPNAQGNSMLFYAAKKGQVNVVLFLLDKGAHCYRNNEKQNIINIATFEVKGLLEEKKLKERRIESLIDEKISQFESMAESINFMESFQPSKYSIKLLQDHARYLAFSSFEEVLSFFKLIDKTVQPKMIEFIVHSFLCCGDIKAAQDFVKQIQILNQTRTSLTRRIEIFSELFCLLEEEMEKNQSEFCESIKEALKCLNILHQFPEKEVEELIKGMSTCGSFSNALNYANKLEGQLKVFARRGLCSSGLEELAIMARTEIKNEEKLAEEQLEERFIELSKELYDLVEESDKFKN